MRQQQLVVSGENLLAWGGGFGSFVRFENGIFSWLLRESVFCPFLIVISSVWFFAQLRMFEDDVFDLVPVHWVLLECRRYVTLFKNSCSPINLKFKRSLLCCTVAVLFVNGLSNSRVVSFAGKRESAFLWLQSAPGCSVHTSYHWDLMKMVS